MLVRVVYHRDESWPATKPSLETNRFFAAWSQSYLEPHTCWGYPASVPVINGRVSVHNGGDVICKATPCKLYFPISKTDIIIHFSSALLWMITIIVAVLILCSITLGVICVARRKLFVEGFQRVCCVGCVCV